MEGSSPTHLLTHSFLTLTFHWYAEANLDIVKKGQKFKFL